MSWWVFRRVVHSSYLIAILSVALVIGVVVSQYLPLGTMSSITWLVTGLVLCGISFWRRKLYIIPLIVVGGCLVGAWRGSVHVEELRVLQSKIGHAVTVTGVVSDDIDTDTSGQSIIRLNQLAIQGRSIAGTLWVSAATDADIKRSDHITVIGKLGSGFGSFGATIYRAQVKNVVRPEPGDQARVFRDWFAGAIRTSMPDPEASLGIGYLVGQKRALPADLVEALKIVGLTHVVVASGYNLTILVRLARRLFMKISKYTAALAASLMIASFVAITGLSPSMSRAGLVAGLSLAAWYYGRKFHPVVLLTFAAAVTVMINPAYMSGDLGWQLSFAAFGGVMILAPLLQRFFFGEKKPGLVRQILGETTSALIVTAPILIGAFGQFSNVAIIANLLVLPFVPFAMLFTFIAGIGALVVPAWATIIGLPAQWLLGYMVQVAENLSHVSWAVTSVQLPPITIVACYVILVGVCLLLWRITKYDLRNANVIE